MTSTKKRGCENWKYVHRTNSLFLWKAKANRSFTSHPRARSAGRGKQQGCPSSFLQCLGFGGIRLELQINHPTTKSLWLPPGFRVIPDYLPEHQQSSQALKHPLPPPGRPSLPFGQCWTSFYTSQTSAHAWGQLSQILRITEYENQRVTSAKHLRHVTVSFLWRGNKTNVFFSTKTIEKLKIYGRNKNPQSHGPIITIISILADYLPGFNFLGQCVF